MDLGSVTVFALLLIAMLLVWNRDADARMLTMKIHQTVTYCLLYIHSNFKILYVRMICLFDLC